MLTAIIGKNFENTGFAQLKYDNIITQSNNNGHIYIKNNKITIWVDTNKTIEQIYTDTNEYKISEVDDVPQIGETLKKWHDKCGDLYEDEDDTLIFKEPIRDYDLMVEIERTQTTLWDKIFPMNFYKTKYTDWKVKRIGICKHDEMTFNNASKINLK